MNPYSESTGVVPHLPVELKKHVAAYLYPGQRALFTIAMISETRVRRQR